MVDIFCPVSEGTAIGKSFDRNIKDSESAEPVIRGTPKDSSVNARKKEESLAPIMNSSDSLLVGSSSNLKDNRSFNKRKGKKRGKESRVLVEGHQGEKVSAEAVAVSSEPRLQESGWVDIGLATANTAQHTKDFAMERADIGSYTSDEWEEENANSDTDGDHTDSSDDDDPKSQVDRLIEKGTLMYMDAENSALSSEDESDDSDFDDDSESDITDVSPLVSAAASPLGMSPVLPRRYFSTSPLALHDNRDIINEGFRETQDPFTWGSHHEEDVCYDDPPLNGQDKAALNMDLLLQAVIELENRSQNNLNHQKSTVLPNPLTDAVFIDPIRDNPHHSHLRKNYLRRKNMSFSNEEVRKIDRENKILLKKIMAAHTRSPGHTAVSPLPHSTSHHRHHKSSNSSVNRKKDEEKIRRENIIILRKIQEAKPSREVFSSGSSFLPHHLSSSNASRSLRSPTGSCGASMRSVSQSPHVNVPTSRKETAL